MEINVHEVVWFRARKRSHVNTKNGCRVLKIPQFIVSVTGTAPRFWTVVTLVPIDTDPCQYNTEIEVEIECGHRKWLLCRMKDNPLKCTERCNRELGCGHICPGICYEDCRIKKCETIVSSVRPPKKSSLPTRPKNNFLLRSLSTTAGFRSWPSVPRGSVPSNVSKEVREGSCMPKTVPLSFFL